MLRQLKLEEGCPRNLSTLGFPSQIKSVDAALHFRNDRYTVFFTGDECWRYLRSFMLSYADHLTAAIHRTNKVGGTDILISLPPSMETNAFKTNFT